MVLRPDRIILSMRVRVGGVVVIVVGFIGVRAGAQWVSMEVNLSMCGVRLQGKGGLSLAVQPRRERLEGSVLWG